MASAARARPRRAHAPALALALVGVALAGAGCVRAGASGGGPAVAPVPGGAAPAAGDVPADAGKLAGAALPFRVVETRSGQTLSLEGLFGRLERAQAICVGETHTSPHDHWVQWKLLDELSRRHARRQVAFALGMEMFERPFQWVLDDFIAGKIDEEVLLSRSGWKVRWGFDWGLYQPLVLLARQRRLGLLALNADKDVVKQVSRGGLRSLSPEERTALPELDVKNAAHRAYFRHATAGHAVPGPSFENFYLAQVLRDETMADRAARWLRGGGAGARARRVLIVAGRGHCHDSAIPVRLRRRGIRDVVSVLPRFEGRGEKHGSGGAGRSDYVIVFTHGAE